MTDYCPPDPLTILPIYNPENWIDTCSGAGGGGGGIGPQGPQGILGISGNVGAQGTQGIGGGAGGAGTQGAQGIIGTQGPVGIPSTTSSLFYSTTAGSISFVPSPYQVGAFNISALSNDSYVQVIYPFSHSSINQLRIVLSVNTTQFPFPSATTFFSGHFEGLLVAHIKKVFFGGSVYTETMVSVSGGPNPFTGAPINITTTGSNLVSPLTSTATGPNAFAINITVFKDPAQGPNIFFKSGGMSVIANTP